MNIQGLQKLTLLDYPGKVACTVFTGGCNMRCPYCHNSALVLHSTEANRISEEEVMSFLQKRVGVLDGICITGGEPLLHRDIAEFIKRVKELGYQVKLDSNGSFPERLKELVESGLIDYVAMDIKNAPAKYAETIGVPGMDLAPIRESVEYLMKGTVPYEFRTTVVKEYHTLEDFEAIGEWIKGASRYFLQGFEDSGDILQPGLHPPDEKLLDEAQNILKDYIQNVEIRGK